MTAENTKSLTEKDNMLKSLVESETLHNINYKIQELKEVKDAKILINDYNNIVNELIQERAKAILLAQMYRAEFDNIVINDKDIEHLQNTIKNFFDLIVQSYKFELDQDNEEQMKAIKIYEQELHSLTNMINADTIKTLFLMGFDFREAIGKPMTDLCARSIRSTITNAEDALKSEKEEKETIKHTFAQICIEAVKHFFGRAKVDSGSGE
ncbi:MAG TPA: hypothetical protein DCG28_03595 [Lachnospiraceae bacterium]|nr:hypothetical protein [Lachnospiraceae bacterium]